MGVWGGKGVSRHFTPESYKEEWRNHRYPSQKGLPLTNVKKKKKHSCDLAPPHMYQLLFEHEVNDSGTALVMYHNKGDIGRAFTIAAMCHGENKKRDPARI